MSNVQTPTETSGASFNEIAQWLSEQRIPNKVAPITRDKTGTVLERVVVVPKHYRRDLEAKFGTGKESSPGDTIHG